MRTWTCLGVGAILAVSLGAPATGAPAKNITACQTIGQPGKYSLGGNLTAAGDCLVIAADFVSIDLAGFTIAGNGTGAGVTVVVGLGASRLAKLAFTAGRFGGALWAAGESSSAPGSSRGCSTLPVTDVGGRALPVASGMNRSM